MQPNHDLLFADIYINECLGQHQGLIAIVGTLDSGMVRTLIEFSKRLPSSQKTFGVFGRFDPSVDSTYQQIDFPHVIHRPAHFATIDFKPYDVVIAEQIWDRAGAEVLLQLAQHKLVIAGISGLDVFSVSDRYSDMGVSMKSLLECLRLVVSHQPKTTTFQILEVGERQRTLMLQGHYTQFHKLELGVREVLS